MNTRVGSMSHPARSAPISLYAQALGPLFHRLAPVLARLHGTGERRLIGVLRVRPARRLLVRIFLWLARMPRIDDRVPCHVFLTEGDGSERWERLIGDQRMVSYQRQGNGREIIERVGLLSIRIESRIRDGSLWQRSCGTTIFGFPLPSLLGIQIVARERPINTRALHCDVRLRSPLLGCLLQYSGTLRFKD